MMAQNTEKWVLGDLTVKFSPEYPIATSNVFRLVQSLDLAKRAVRSAIDSLDTISTATAAPTAKKVPTPPPQRVELGGHRQQGPPVAKPQAPAIAEIPYVALRYHFHLPNLADGGALAD